MATSAHTYNFPEVREGNSCWKVLFRLPEEDVYNLAGAKIYMQLRKKPGQIVAAEFSTVNGKLVQMSDYSFMLPSQIITIPADTYGYDILIVFADGRRRTYIKGTWIITSVNTRKK